jgi:hypothetical protein
VDDWTRGEIEGMDAGPLSDSSSDNPPSSNSPLDRDSTPPQIEENGDKLFQKPSEIIMIIFIYSSNRSNCYDSTNIYEGRIFKLLQSSISNLPSITG